MIKYLHLKFTSILYLTVFFILTGCLSTPVDYMNMSDQKLCIDYLTLPSFNLNQSAREEALRIRGINCAQYVGAASVKIKADQNFDNFLKGLSNAPSYQSPPKNSGGSTCFFKRDVDSGMNKICYYDCLGSAHAMTISIARICPLTTLGQ